MNELEEIRKKGVKMEV